jgi:hypothetical protein
MVQTWRQLIEFVIALTSLIFVGEEAGNTKAGNDSAEQFFWRLDRLNSLTNRNDYPSKLSDCGSGFFWSWLTS